MKTVRVLQLGGEDFSGSIRIPDCAEWNYEPDFSQLPEKDFDVVILDRQITIDEFDYLVRFSRAYGLFITEQVPLEKREATWRLYIRKMGRRLSEEKLRILLKEELPDYFSGSYGEKYIPQHLSVAQGFQGSIFWRGFEGVDLDGDYGDELVQIVYWRNNIRIEENQAMEFWLEYKKDDAVELVLEIILFQFDSNADSKFQNVWMLTEKELKNIVYVENKNKGRAYLFVSLKAKGKGCLTITALHSRNSRRGKGNFIPGGKRSVTSEREEIFYYFDPGNLKPPLNVYFSGYKTKEGFEGYYMMRRMEHPFLLIAEARLEGGAFYLGSKEYEDEIEQIIRKYMELLNFQSSQLILSGLSMGAFGALYYGCRIHPHTILLGKPLASIGDVAKHERLKCPEGSHSWLDVLHKACGNLSQDAVQKANDRFWDLFDHTDWSGTRFAVAYMIEDDLDGEAYENLQSHLSGTCVSIYGKGLHGRHNDDTPGIVNWFLKQYGDIIQREFDKKPRKTDGQKR